MLILYLLALCTMVSINLFKYKVYKLNFFISKISSISFLEHKAATHWGEEVSRAQVTTPWGGKVFTAQVTTPPGKQVSRAPDRDCLNLNCMSYTTLLIHP